VVAGLATGRLDLPTSVAVSTVAWGIVWYLLGFFLYALLGGVTTPLRMLTVATIALLVRLTGRIYANAVMRIGARVRVRDALAR
jgi:hypothetical protein